MENETIALSRTDIDNIVKDVRASVQAIEKGSKLRKHMLIKNNSGDCKYIVKHGKELKSSRN